MEIVGAEKLPAGWPEGGLAKGRASYVIRLGSTFGFLQLARGCKQWVVVVRNQEAGIHWPSPDSSALIVTEKVVRLRGFASSEVMGQRRLCHIRSGHCPFV